MQPLFKHLLVRLFRAAALCARVLIFFAGVLAVAEAHRELPRNSAPPRPVRASQELGDHFDILAVLNTLEPFSRTLPGCHSTSKVC